MVPEVGLMVNRPEVVISWMKPNQQGSVGGGRGRAASGAKPGSEHTRTVLRLKL
jgi:hypothetical protein